MSSAAGRKKKKSKRRRACAECFRLREKCVYGDAADGEPCQRCSKLGKRCEPRNPESAARRKAEKEAGTLKRDKPNACAECYRTRNKCVQTSSGTCERCASVGKVCMPRILVRRTPESQAEFEDELSRVCASMSELCACEGTTADLTRTRKAAADMPVLISELRLKAVPPATLGMLRYMMFMAQVDGSLERLHKTTAMAATMGASEVIDALDTDVPPLPQVQMRSLAEYAIKHFELDDPQSAVLHVISNVGKRTVHTNPAYNLFYIHGALEKQVRDGYRPVIESWPPFMVDKARVRKIVDDTHIEIMTTATSIDTPYGPLYLVSTKENVLEAVDLAGAHFEVTLNMNVAVQENGQFYLGSVRMRDIRPLDAHASHRLSELHSSATDAESLTGSVRSNKPVDVGVEDDNALAPYDLWELYSGATDAESLAGSVRSNKPADAEVGDSDMHYFDESLVIPEGGALLDSAMDLSPPPSLPPEQQAVADQLLQDLFSSS